MNLLFFKYIIAVIIFFNITFINAQSTPTVFLIGDSTCSNYTASVYPRKGWGMEISSYFDNTIIKFNNCALSGRSSKTFYDGGSWNPVINAIKTGDFLIIQFGHNDEKTTDPYTTYQEYLTKYIDEARAKGAYPILATSIYRNYWKNGIMIDSHGDYPPAMRALAIQKNVPLIDTTILTKTLFESLGQPYTTNNIFLNLVAGAYTNYPNGVSDNTHLQENGAIKVSGLIANELSKLSQSYSYLSIFSSASLGNSDFDNKKIDLEVLNEQITICSTMMIDQLIIFDLSGRIIFNNNQLFNKIEINTLSWCRGVYCAKIVISGKNNFHKFILLK